ADSAPPGAGRLDACDASLRKPTTAPSGPDTARVAARGAARPARMAPRPAPAGACAATDRDDPRPLAGHSGGGRVRAEAARRGRGVRGAPVAPLARRADADRRAGQVPRGARR